MQFSHYLQARVGSVYTGDVSLVKPLLSTAIAKDKAVSRLYM